MSLFAPIFEALNRNKVRYVVVGGLAVVLRGVARLTADIDLYVDLNPTEALKAMRVFGELGFRARAPVPLEEFARADLRESWVQDKGMRVFSLWDPKNPMREVDLFVEHPIPFDDVWSRSTLIDGGDVEIRTASIADLISLKTLASRPQDLEDIERLQEIAERAKST